MSASLTNRCICAEDLITAIDMGVKGSLLISEGVTFIDRMVLRVSGSGAREHRGSPSAVSQRCSSRENAVS